MTFKEIKNTGIKRLERNGSRDMEIIWEIKETKEKFRLFIHSESYDFQSYAKLSKWNDKDGWNVITSVNPHTDYNCNIAYSNQYRYTAFDPIIKDMKKIAKSFISNETN